MNEGMAFRHVRGLALALCMLWSGSPVHAATTLPGGVQGPSLWLDAAQLTGLTNGATVTAWTDLSGNNNHATRGQGTPTYQARVINGQPVVRFSAAQSAFNFSRIENIRTVFWVVREDVSPSDLTFLLGDTDTYDFHRGDNGNLWSAQNTHASILKGTTRLMGAQVNGTTTALPEGKFQLITLVTDDTVQANTLSADRSHGRTWVGDVAEVLIYTRALTTTEENKVGEYLATKYGLVTRYTPATILSFGTNVVGSCAHIGLPVGGKAAIEWTVPFETVLTNLAPVFTLSSGTCTQKSGCIPSPNFTAGSKTYTVTANGVTNVYAVTVTKAPPSTACDMNSFNVNFAGSRTSIFAMSDTTGKVVVNVPVGTTEGQLAALAPTLKLSREATCTLPSPALKFDVPVHYIVRAQDGKSAKDYTVTVTTNGSAYRLFVVKATPQGLSVADYDYLGLIPVSKHINNGVPAIFTVASTNDFATNVYLQDYLRRYHPTLINTINFTATIPHIASSPIMSPGSVELSVCMATNTWASSKDVVLVSDAINSKNYPNVLQASALASALDAPLIYYNSKATKQALIKKAITTLGAREVIYVNAEKTKPALATLVLSNPETIVKYLDGRNIKVDYFAATNPKDLKLLSGSKLSLVAPFIAARRNGVVVPITSYAPNTKELFHYTGYEPISNELRQLYQGLGRYPDYLALVGNTASIPFSYSAPNEVAGSLENAPTDLDYAEADEDRFPDIAIGRIMAYTLFDATLYACRISTYEELFDGAWEKSLLGRGKDPMFSNYGFEFKEFLYRDVTRNKPFDAAIYLHGEHSAQSLLGGSFDTGSRHVLAPMVIHSTGCAAAAIDFETVNDGVQPPVMGAGELIVVNTLVRLGAVSFLGSTRLCCGNEAAMRGAFQAAMFKGEPFGRCYLKGVTANSLNPDDAWRMDLRRNWILLGDPAFKLNIPAAPRVAPPSYVVTHETPVTDVLTVNAAAYSDFFKWQILPEHVEEWGITIPLYMLNMPGLYFWDWGGQDGPNRLAYMVRHTTTRPVARVEQLGSCPANLGMDTEWGSGWVVNANQDSTTDVLWHVRLIDFDWQAGAVVNQVTNISFRITYPLSLSPLLSPIRSVAF